MFLTKPKRRKLDQYLHEHRKDPEIALTEMTRLSNRVWRILIGLFLSLMFLALLWPFETWRQGVCLGGMVFLMNGLGWAALGQIRPRLFDRPSSFNQFILLLLLTVVVSKLFFVLGWSPFLAPLPMLAMVLTMIYGQSVSILVSIGMAFYLSILSPRLVGIDLVSIAEWLGPGSEPGPSLLFYAALVRLDFVLGGALTCGAMVSVILLKKIRQQSRPTLVGGLAGFFQGVVVLAFSFTDMGSRELAGGMGEVWEILIDPGWALAGGILSGALVTILLPGIERAFGIVTERRLLALSDPNNELLRTLRNRAPGTYQHTLGVAQLSGPAAEAVGADSLLVQVGAYYHDIGKIVKPEYFVENMGEDKSIHSRLRPSMSKLVIISHVKEGVELALEEKLPEKIIDMIPMHHGTTVVEYFFHKALELEEGESKGKESETEYRYPGPKARFPEAGILMLADAVEAIAKSMKDPNPNRFRDMVRSVIQKRLLDGQLDECRLTIKDLRRIEDSFVRTLTNMYHGRIRYPSAGEAKAAGDVGEGPAESAAEESSAADSPEAGRLQNGDGQPRKLVPAAPSERASSS